MLQFSFLFFFFVVLGFELRAYTLSHPTSPVDYLLGLASNQDPPDL
jgi:hypothetical protein